MLMVARPTIGGGSSTGDLFVIWEELDSLDADTVTGFMNAEIWGARSCNNGETWGDAVNLTNNPGITDRFSSIAAMNDDSVRFVYEEDLITGMYVHPSGSESPMSTNPIRYVAVHKDVFQCGPVGVEEEPEGWQPDVSKIFQSQPNPFTYTTRIRYQVGTPGKVVLKIYDIAGRPVRTLLNGHEEAGVKTVSWNGRDDAWNEVSNGIYFYHLRLDGGFSATGKVALIR
jgi:hypothetical protein